MRFARRPCRAILRAVAMIAAGQAGPIPFGDAEMSIPTFEYTSTNGKRFRACTLQALIEAAGLKTHGARAIYGARGTQHQGIPLVILEQIDNSQGQVEQRLDEDAVLSVLNKLLRGKTNPVDAARALTEAGTASKRGRPRKTG